MIAQVSNHSYQLKCTETVGSPLAKQGICREIALHEFGYLRNYISRFASATSILARQDILVMVKLVPLLTMICLLVMIASSA